MSFLRAFLRRPRKPSLKRRRILIAEQLECRRVLTTVFYVDGDEPAGGNGTPGMPFNTIQLGVDAAAGLAGVDLVLVHPATGGYVENVIIDDPDGVVVKGSTSNPANIVVESPGADPLDDVFTVKSDDVQIALMQIRGGDDGIKAKDVTGLTLFRVQAVHNTDDGLDVDNENGVPNGDVTVIGGSYSHNGDDGIETDFVENLTLTIDVSGGAKRVVVVGNGNDGLDVEDSKTVNIDHATFKRNVEDGIELDRITTVTVERTSSTRNGEDGLDVVVASSVSVVRGSYSHNRQDGIERV